MSTDRNLLFGILAVQMEFVSRDALIQAMNAWVLAKAKPLGQILQEQGALSAADHALLDSVVQRHLQLHGDDAERSLSAVTVPPFVQQILRDLGDNDIQARVTSITRSSTPEEHPTLLEARPGAAGCRYRILRPHAKGGLGEVFVALDLELHREVALKQMQEKYADDEHNRVRFVLEAEVSGRLEHPAIVPVYGLGQDAAGRPYYAMRFIEGDTLRDSIRRFHEADAGGRDPGERRLALRHLLSQFVAVCNAVAYAHSRGILHRDLKPRNILLGKFGETLLVDWGLAKVVGRPEVERGKGEGTLHPMTASDLATQAGETIGTPAFMAPEQADGRLDLLGPASDIYGLGATLYALLTGRAPVSGQDTGEVLRKAARGDWPPPRQVNALVPAALEAVCRKAMALKPDERYASAGDLARDIERWLADEPVSAYAEPWADRARRWLGRHQTLLTAAAACVLVTVVGLAVGMVLLGAASERERQAKQQEQLARTSAERQRDDARRNLYFSHMHLAKRAWDDADMPRLFDLLAEHERHPGSDEPDLRGWEWYYLWRLGHSSDLLTLKGHSDVVTAATYSPDSRLLATASYDHTIKIWDAVTAQEITTLTGHTGKVYAVTFSKDGKRLASASEDRTAKVWDTATWKPIQTLTGHKGPVPNVAFSPDGRRLATASEDGTVKLWDAATGQTTRTLTKHDGPVSDVCFSPDGRRMATSSHDHTVRLWDATSGELLFTLKEHTGWVEGVCFSPDGRRVASGSTDRSVRVWDATTGQIVHTLRGHRSWVEAVCFSPDSRRLASASYDGTVRVWDMTTGDETLSLRGHTAMVGSVHFSPDAKRLATASWDKTARVWDALSGQDAITITATTDSRGVSVACLSRDGKRVASASFDGTINLWDAMTGQESSTLKGPPASVYGLAFSPDGEHLASAATDKTLIIWNLAEGKPGPTLRGHTGAVLAVCYSPDGQRLASASIDRTVRIWDAATGQQLRVLEAHTEGVTAVCYSPDGERLASASRDGRVRVWDLATGLQLAALRGTDGWFLGVCYSPRGDRLAGAGADNLVHVWDPVTGDEVLSLKGHAGFVEAVCFSTDGKRLATASRDGTIKVWDAASGQEALTLRGHRDWVTSVAFSPDGARLVSASRDGTVRIWRAASAAEAER